MPGICNDTIIQFKDRIKGFKQEYVIDWDNWQATNVTDRPNQFGVILRKWQTCRPNIMRRTRAESQHIDPFLDDLMIAAQPHVTTLVSFDIRMASSFTNTNNNALRNLWNILESLSYLNPDPDKRSARHGRAGIVGISKALMLLSDGKVGPAFDSTIQKHLGIRKDINYESANGWIRALNKVHDDINKFEVANNTTLQAASGHHTLHGGRIYDMALGPR